VDFSKYSTGTKIVLRNKQARDGTSELMRFDVVRQEPNESVVPAKLSKFEPLDPRQAVATRTFDFFYAGMDRGWVINGKPFDPTRMDAQPKLGTSEIWRLRSDFHHPLHLHLAHFQVLTHGGRPRSGDAGWKDTVNMVAGETAEVLVKFDGYKGRYVFHCHNLEHEDMAMMGNFEVV
jgi:spore coat protein A